MNMNCKKPFLSQLFWVALALGSTSQSLGQDRVVSTQQSLNASSMLLLKIDSEQLAIPKKIEQMRDELKDKPIASLIEASQRNLVSIRELTKGQTVYMSVDLPYTAAVALHAVAPKSVPASDLEKLAKYIYPQIAVSDRSTLELTKLTMGTDLGSATPGEPPAMPAEQASKWQSALEATKEFPVQCVMLLPDYVLKTFREIKPDLPEELGGGSAEWLLEGARWISIGLDTKNATARIVVQSGSEEGAKIFAKNLPKLIRSVVNTTVPDKESALALWVLIGMIKPVLSGERVVVSLTDDQTNQSLLQFAATVANSLMAPITATTTSNRMKQFALGFHNYQSAYQAFPTYLNMAKTKAKSGLSWRVHLLPFFGFAELYQEFKLDEAWDSPHNIKLLAKMPAIYLPTGDMNETVELKPYHTTYVAPIGKKTVFGQSEPMQFRNITDGTSNTIAFVELKREHAIPWTSPEEYPFDESNPTAKLRDYNGKTVIAMFDGSVTNLKLDLPKETWLALFSRNGGEVVNLE
ncbi:MAG: DUF1559 domain-containing protein [Planctomycetota bacterium]|nr:DUF1559 domain-containing protein [Planctomycetota bacterium]